MDFVTEFFMDFLGYITIALLLLFLLFLAVAAFSKDDYLVGNQKHKD